MAYISLDEMNTPAKATPSPAKVLSPAPTKTGGYISLDEMSSSSKAKTPSLTPIKGLGMTVNATKLQASNKLYANTLPKVTTPKTLLKPGVDISNLTGDKNISQFAGQTISPANPNNKTAPIGTSFGDVINKGASNIFNTLFTKETPAQQDAAMTVQKTLVDRQLADIGKKLGLDKNIPLDNNYDPTTAKIRQEKQIADYVRSNYDTIKSNLKDPSVLPLHPELMGPAYNEIKSKLPTYTKALGMRDNPTTTELLTGLMMLPIVSSVVAAPVAGLIGLGAFTALAEAEHYFFGDTVANKISDALGVNSGTRDVLGLIELFAQGKMLHSINVKAPAIAEKFTKNIITEYRPGTKIEIPAEKIADIYQTGTKISQEELQAWKKLGLSGNDLKTAVRNGVSIEIPPEKVVSIVDKPLWAKIKGLVNIKSEPVVSRTSMGQRPTVSNKALPGKGQTSLGKITDKLMSETKKNIATHGPEVTMTALVENLGIEPAQAQRIVDAAATPTMTDDYALIHEEAMSKIAPEESKYVSLDEISPTKEENIIQKEEISKKEENVVENVENKGVIENKVEENKPTEQLKPVESKGKVKTSRLAERVMETLGNATEADIANLPTYKEMNIKSSVKTASDIVTKDTYKALNMLQGKEPLPEGVNEGTMFLALTQYAKLTGDSELGLEISKMAANETSLSFTAMGQNIRALADFNKDNPVNMIMKVEEARKKEIMKKVIKGKNLGTIKKGIIEKGKVKLEKKLVKIPKMKELEDFINSIEC